MDDDDIEHLVTHIPDAAVSCTSIGEGSGHETRELVYIRLSYFSI
jgi:hypothetical protein